MAYGFPYAPLLGDVILLDPKRESSGDLSLVMFEVLPRLCKQKTIKMAPRITATPTPAAIPIIAGRLKPGFEVEVICTSVSDLSPGNVIWTALFEKMSPFRPIGSPEVGRC